MSNATLETLISREEDSRTTWNSGSQQYKKNPAHLVAPRKKTDHKEKNGHRRGGFFLLGEAGGGGERKKKEEGKRTTLLHSHGKECTALLFCSWGERRTRTTSGARGSAPLHGLTREKERERKKEVLLLYLRNRGLHPRWPTDFSKKAWILLKHKGPLLAHRGEKKRRRRKRKSLAWPLKKDPFLLVGWREKRRRSLFAATEKARRERKGGVSPFSVQQEPRLQSGRRIS